LQNCRIAELQEGRFQFLPPSFLQSYHPTILQFV
jgi:hypothetical protein